MNSFLIKKKIVFNRIHVFTLLFVDALMSTCGSGISLVTGHMILTGLLNRSFSYCNISYLTLYLPSYYGSALTLLVAIIRYISAKRSALNIQLSKNKVTFRALFAFVILIITTMCYIAFNVTNDNPYAHVIEVCLHQDQEPRAISKWTVLAIQTGNLFNVVSLHGQVHQEDSFTNDI
jgi:hypothetical protein